MSRPNEPELPFSEAEIRAAVKSARSIRETARNLGVGNDDSVTRRLLPQAIRQLGIETSHFSFAVTAFNEEAVRAAVAASSSFAQVMRTLGLATDAGNHRKIRRLLQRLQLGTSHFTRRSTDLPIPAPRPVSDILRVFPAGSPRLTHPRLRRAMESRGIEYRCLPCGNTGEWMGGPITLQIDHINGDWLDNRLENLRFLCLNCHARTETWCGGNRGRRVQLRSEAKEGATEAEGPVA